MNVKSIIKHGLIETLNNFKRARSAHRWAKEYRGKDRLILPPSGYDLVFHEKFKGELDLSRWRMGQPWGDFHPGNLGQYYDTSGDLSYNSNGRLVLSLKNKPKFYKKSDLPEWRRDPSMPDEFTIPIGTGLVSTLESWQYGWFEAWIKLPIGINCWPAFWLSGKDEWPPEIDIFEAYSNIGPKYNGHKYFNSFGNIDYLKIQPNIHYGSVELNSKDAYGAYDVPVTQAGERFVQYVCHWKADFIRIYYDGLLIFETTRPEILKWFNSSRSQMIMILNHGRYKNDPSLLPEEGSMLVKNVNVYQSK